MRPPKWKRDELILALNLYFQSEPGQIHAKNPLIIELSELLNQLPIHGDKREFESFRNPNGVGLKLSNFLALDDTYTGKGMISYSNLDKEVFNEFKDQKELLGSLAKAIKNSVEYTEIKNDILNVKETYYDDFWRPEGSVLYRYHLARERNATLVKKKKEQALKLFEKLECELCEFDFFKTYGEIGYGYIECHHRKPLHTLTEDTKTKLDDLMLVCANCHRMLHRGWDKTDNYNNLLTQKK